MHLIFRSVVFQSKASEEAEVGVKIQYSSHHSCYFEREQTMKTMIGEPARSCNHYDVPPWDPLFPVVVTSSVNFHSSAWGHDSVMGMRSSLPSHHPAADEADMPVDVFSSDYFRMFEFKVRRCARGRAHDWTECPYAHPGEKARRRDPRKFNYSGTPCDEFRKGSCRKGDSCEFAHGVFECWLHPARYRTQPCKDGLDCLRRVCFFAHSPEQLRIINQNDLPTQGPCELFIGGSPSVRIGQKEPFVSSPKSILASPPLSPLSEASPIPSNRPPISCESVSEIVSSMQNVHLSRKEKGYPSQWKFDNLSRSGLPACEYWGRKCEDEEEPAMERVESGRNLRVKMYAKLSKENSLERNESAASSPDIGWVSELIK